MKKIGKIILAYVTSIFSYFLAIRFFNFIFFNIVVHFMDFKVFLMFYIALIAYGSNFTAQEAFSLFHNFSKISVVIMFLILLIPNVFITIFWYQNLSLLYALIYGFTFVILWLGQWAEACEEHPISDNSIPEDIN